MTKGSPASARTASRPLARARRWRAGKRGDEALALHDDVLEARGARHRRQQQPEIELARGERRRLLGRQHFAQRERARRAAPAL